MKKVKTLKGNKTFTWKIKGLKKHKSYKAYVSAWKYKDGKKVVIKTSLVFHAFSSGYTKKYTNPKSVKVNKVAVTLTKGKTFKIKAKAKGTCKIYVYAANGVCKEVKVVVK